VAAPIRPPRLQAGQKLWLTAPASSMPRPGQVDEIAEYLRGEGFEVEASPSARDHWRFFGGTDAERARDINAAFARRDIDAVVCIRGGYGCMRVLEGLDWDLIRRNPKLVVGYSDITALVNPIRQRAGVAAIHGPQPIGSQEPFTRDWLWKVMMRPEPAGTIPTAPSAGADFAVRGLRPGRAQGRLAGGNLTLISCLMGTPWEVGEPGDILFFEDVNESAYRIDRMLTQLLLAGRLQRAAGLAFGQFTRAEPSDPEEERRDPSVHDVIAERTASLGIPVLMGLPFGHVRLNAALPVGCLAEIDADAGTLSILEPAVS
jgi:muramoyltetrapeptide carboxypeptidase